MPDIFVNFRKADRSLERDRLYRALVARYHPDQIFKSGVSIPIGADYAAVLIEQARTCKIMLVLIGPDWMTVDDYGYCPSYWDQMEIATALQAGNTVIPVLLGATVMLPRPDDLPTQIAQLGRLQFHRLSETSFGQDAERLLDQLATMLPPSATVDGAPADAGQAPASPPLAAPTPSLSFAAGSGSAQSGHGNILAQGDAVSISGSHAGRDLIGIQKKKVKLLGAEVPAAAVVIGLLGLGAAGAGTAIAVTDGGTSGKGMPSATATGQTSRLDQLPQTTGAVPLDDTSVTDTTSPAPRIGLLYAGKTAQFSDAWAVENHCPGTIVITFTEDGPKVATDTSSGDGGDSAKQAPHISWSPPCSGMTTQLDFDGNGPVASVQGTPSEQDCQKAADQTYSDGDTLSALNTAALSNGDAFCEDDRQAGRIVLMQVSDLSTTAPVRMTWSATVWATTPQQEQPHPPGSVIYSDKNFSLKDKNAPGKRDCVTGAVLFTSSLIPGPSVAYDRSTADMGYYSAGCVMESNVIEFEHPTALVTGDQTASSCENAAAGSGKTSLDIPLASLKAGDEYCTYAYQGSDLVVLIKVTSVTLSPVRLGFSATAWKAPTSH